MKTKPDTDVALATMVETCKAIVADCHMRRSTGTMTHGQARVYADELRGVLIDIGEGPKGMEMSESKHTPGPWRVGTEPFDYWETIRAADDMPVATAAMSARYKHEDQGCLCPPEIAANANLIAAAPELLQASYDASVLLEQMIDSGSVPGCEDDMKSHLEGIEQVIAKAEGRSNG